MTSEYPRETSQDESSVSFTKTAGDKAHQCSHTHGKASYSPKKIKKQILARPYSDPATMLTFKKLRKAASRTGTIGMKPRSTGAKLRV